MAATIRLLGQVVLLAHSSFIRNGKFLVLRARVYLGRHQTLGRVLWQQLVRHRASKVFLAFKMSAQAVDQERLLGQVVLVERRLGRHLLRLVQQGRLEMLPVPLA